MALVGVDKEHLTQDKKRLLEDLLNKHKVQKKEVVYGVYDNSNAPLFTKINDFYIDHYPISPKEKAYFFHLLAVMIDGGVPIVEGLTILAHRTKNEHFQRVLYTLAYQIREGGTLSTSMSRFPDVFDESEVGIVESGEAIGRLDEVMFRLSSQIEKSNAIRMKLWAASIYPIAVLVILGLVAVGMFVFVLPTLLNLLTESGVSYEDLPASTKILIFMQRIFTDYLLIIIFSIVVLFSLFKVYTESDTGKFWWHYYLLRLPVIGTLIRKAAILQFVEKLGLLLDSGLSIISTLKIIATSTKNELYALQAWKVIGDVEQGISVSNSLSQAPFLFPEDVVTMLRIGERSATVGSISKKIGEQYDKELSHSIKKLTALFEPIMIVVVGLFVAVLALAIMGPIFSLTKTL